MNWRPMFTIVVIVTALLPAAATVALGDVVQANLCLWLDAADHNADGRVELGSGNVWRNKATTGVLHDATLVAGGEGPAPAWAGSGTLASPYAVQFRFNDMHNGGYALVAHSAGGTDLDTTVYTYEVWARRNGAGGNGTGRHGALIAHCASQGWGPGGLNYCHAAIAPLGAQELFAEGGDPAIDTPLPHSAGALAAAWFHHIMLTRAGDGPDQSAFYLDGVLRGRFKTGSVRAGRNTAPLTIGGRFWSAAYPADYFLDCDIAVVRVYTAALSAAEVEQNFRAEAARFGLSASGKAAPEAAHRRGATSDTLLADNHGARTIAGELPAVARRAPSF